MQRKLAIIVKLKSGFGRCEITSMTENAQLHIKTSELKVDTEIQMNKDTMFYMDALLNILD